MSELENSFAIQETTRRLAADPVLVGYLDLSHPIPKTFQGSGNIRLIILGQDPTVKNTSARASITTVLNLDKSGRLKSFLQTVCGLLDVDLETEVYATNLVKNFFIQPPTQITEINVFGQFLPYWMPVLEAEVACFPGIPVLALGEPLLSVLACAGAGSKMRDYWGYCRDWKTGQTAPFGCLPAETNLLHRTVFPYPHQPSWQRKKFYSQRLAAFSAFVHPMIPAVGAAQS